MNNLPELSTEKLQKILSRAGLGSRREMEEWILQGRVSVNGKLAKLGDRASARDKITVDGQAVFSEVKTRVLLYNKPIDEICTRDDPEGRPTVFDHLPALTAGRWVSVGRLDINTTGLLLFTNDGELANQLMHPSSQIEREYLARVLGDIDALVLERLTKGVRLEDGLARFKQIELQGGRGANQTVRVVIEEGRNREVKRLFESQNLTVSRLKRIRYGRIALPVSLRLGDFVELSEKEIRQLKLP